MNGRGGNRILCIAFLWCGELFEMRSFVLLAVLVVGVLLLAGCAQNQDSNGGNPNQPSSDSNFQGLGAPSGNPISPPNPVNLPTYSLSDVAVHNTPSDCWLAINGSVYNFTSSPMMQQNANLSALCGSDATSTFSSMMGRVGNFNGPGNFTRNGTAGAFGGRPNGGYNGSGNGGSPGGMPNGGSGPFNRTRGGAGGFGRMMIGRLAQ